jgi:hypothetical protein
MTTSTVSAQLFSRSKDRFVLALTTQVPVVAIPCILRGPDGPANQP